MMKSTTRRIDSFRSIFIPHVGAHKSPFLIPRRTFHASSSNLLLSLTEQLPHIEYSTNRYELERHGRGESYHPTCPPDMVAMPRNTQEVQELVRYCFEHKIPVIPFGSGTSLEGHVAALRKGLCIDLVHLKEIELPDMGGDSLPDPIATVGAGVTRKELNEALRHTGMQFVVDPGADATIGGMVATGASGTTTVRYGNIRENLLQLECVLASDSAAPIVRAGTKALKNSAGYDLLSLMCGSEGTLGIITKISVRLHPVPQHVVAAVCVFETLAQAAQAVAALKLTEVPVSRCELLDATSVEAFNAYNQATQKPLEAKPTLFFEFHGSSESSLQELVSTTESICTGDFGGSGFQFATSEEERKFLWSARHSLYHASLALRPGSKGAIVTDACVPLSHFASLIEATAADVKKYNVVGPCFGHAGDGNLHCILALKEDDPQEYLDRCHKVNENIIARTLAVGGTCTGEHGVGYGKMQHLERQYGTGAVHMMKAIKKALDPFNIMNPGKVVDPFS